MQSHAGYASRLFDTGLFSDCTVCCTNKKWYLHRSVLAQRCSFFRACFSDSFKESLPNAETGVIEVSMHEDDPAALERMLRWLYTLEYPRLAGLEQLTFEGSQISMTGEATDAKAHNFKPSLTTYSNSSSDSITKDEGYLSDSSRSSSDQTQEKFSILPTGFWTSELALFALADKYDLSELAQQASTSIIQTADTFLPNANPNSDNNPSSDESDNFVDMLEQLYTELPSTSTSVRQLQQALIDHLAMTIAARVSYQPRLVELMGASPMFAADLVQVLRRAAESQAITVQSTPQKDESTFGDEQQYNCNRNTNRQRVYIPMNEDSDSE